MSIGRDRRVGESIAQECAGGGGDALDVAGVAGVQGSLSAGSTSDGTTSGSGSHTDDGSLALGINRNNAHYRRLMLISLDKFLVKSFRLAVVARSTAALRRSASTPASACTLTTIAPGPTLTPPLPLVLSGRTSVSGLPVRL